MLYTFLLTWGRRETGALIFREGISQADVLAHPFDDARERIETRKRVSIRFL